VIADSQVFVAERREGGAWLRVASFPRAAVRSVERRIPGPGGDRWLTEDVRTSAGLTHPPQHEAGAPSAASRLRERRSRATTTRTRGETR
jgi:hypothetical protein